MGQANATEEQSVLPGEAQAEIRVREQVVPGTRLVIPRKDRQFHTREHCPLRSNFSIATGE
jgi:hypothetical protein